MEVFKNADEFYENSTDIGMIIAYELKNHNYSCNVTKILKLMYFLYGIFLWNEKEILFWEKPHARPFGPVFPTARKKIIKKFEWKEIIVTDEDIKNIKRWPKLNKYIDIIIKRLWEKSSWSLVGLTHQEWTPRTKTKDDVFFMWNDTIQDELIYEYFSDPKFNLSKLQ